MDALLQLAKMSQCKFRIHPRLPLCLCNAHQIYQNKSSVSLTFLTFEMWAVTQKGRGVGL